MAYLDVAGFRARTTMPSEDVDALEVDSPDFLTTALGDNSDHLDARLRKRYVAPFEEPYPRAVIRWLTHLTTRDAYLKRGVSPTSEQDSVIISMAERAETEIQEAANAETGLFDLPLRADTTATGISLGGPLGYSEASPFVWQDIQAEIGRSEDYNS